MYLNMLRRFCNLCLVTETTTVQNLRKFTATPIISRNHAEAIQIDIQDEVPSEPVPTEKKKPIIACKRKEFNFYPGQTYKKYEKFPIASDGWLHTKSRGDYFTIYPILQSEIEAEEEEEYRDENEYGDDDENEVSGHENDVNTPRSFEELGIDPQLIKNLQSEGIDSPTLIQSLAIPQILNSTNTSLIAETGCGKTLAYLIPLIQQVLHHKAIPGDRPGNSPLVLILTPSRELALQISSVARKLTYDLNINVETLVSGKTKKFIQNPSMKNVDIVVGTVGLICKLAALNIYKLKWVLHTVADEAHALFDETFDRHMKSILRKIDFRQFTTNNDSEQGSQLILASATMPDDFPSYLPEFVNLKSLIKVTTPNHHRILVPQKFIRLGSTQKAPTMLRLIKPRAMRKQPTIIFSNDSATSDWISIFLNHMNAKTIPLNSRMHEKLRQEKWNQFQNGEVSILSTTNAGARGLDTTIVDFVLNFDFPLNTADYIHRCGRTGRVGGVQNGQVVNFITRNMEVALVQKLERSARRYRPLPIFDIYDQTKKREMDAELQKLIGKTKIK